MGEQTDQPGPFDAVHDVVDRSIAMYLVRRVLGRPTGAPQAESAHHEPIEPGTAARASDPDASATDAGAAAPLRPAAALTLARDPSADGDAVAGAAPVPVAARTSQLAATYYGADGSRLARPSSLAPAALLPVTQPAAVRVASGRPRERLVRDSGAALLVLAVVGIVAIAWPHGPATRPSASVFSVVRGSGSPDAGSGSPAGPLGSGPASLPAVIVSPSGVVAGETNVPTQLLTPTPPNGTPTRTPGVTPTSTGSTPIPTVRPTSSASGAPTPTASATPQTTSSPMPDTTPTPTTTPVPSPDPAPDPPPDPSPP